MELTVAWAQCPDSTPWGLLLWGVFVGFMGASTVASIAALVIFVIGRRKRDR